MNAAKAVLDILLAASLAFLGWTAYEAGIFFNAPFVFVIVATAARIVVTLWRSFRRNLELRLGRTPRASDPRRHWLQMVNGWTFWLLAAGTLKLCIMSAQFTPEVFDGLRLMIYTAIGMLLLLELLPARRLLLATNLVFAGGAAFLAIPWFAILASDPMAEGLVLSPPFRGNWLVVQGGRSGLINHH